ncbi:MAG: hypothetical protein HYT07_02210 [Candidatus Levybacteria bacterium]|nr:hypothetical protein [Candidatus Levybacteria bacterium]
MGKTLLSIIIVVLFGVVAGLPLIHKGLPPTHDGEYHIVRFFLFNEAFNDGNIYPRWAAHLNNGFGVPLFTFVYPLPNYIAVFFHSFGISFMDSFKLEMFVAILSGAIFFYLWAKEFWGRLGGVVSSVFYTFSPYHFVDIYIRGSVGEVWALAFFPAFLWIYTKFVATRKKRFSIFSSIFLALIIFSHNILALMFFFFALSYASLLIYKEKNKKYLILNTLYLILLGLGLSAIFWLPAIYEAKFVTGLQIFDVSAHFPDLYQLLIPSWGSGFSGAGLQNQLSPQIGIANLIAISISLIVIFFQIKKKDKKYFHTIFFMAWFIFVLFLMLSISFFVWQTIPVMKYFQFPWRLLSIEVLFASFLAGSIFSLGIHKWIKIFSAILLISLTFILGIGYAKPAYYHYRDDDYYINRSNFIDGTNSPGNVFNTIYLNSIPEKEEKKVVFTKGKGETIAIEEKSNFYRFKIDTRENSEILINIAYFPGWEADIDGNKIPIEIDDGRISVSIPDGKYELNVIFKDTFIRKFAIFISTLCFFMTLILFIKNKFARI